jgi:hypothetical protein
LFAGKCIQGISEMDVEMRFRRDRGFISGPWSCWVFCGKTMWARELAGQPTAPAITRSGEGGRSRGQRSGAGWNLFYVFAMERESNELREIV